jgi:predicted enzyme related to lactoylglutathione lyase
MADESEPDTAAQSRDVFRPGGVSYLELPARHVEQSAEFYRAVFGWRLRGDPQSPSFSDGTGHVIGHWRTDLTVVGSAGVMPYVDVEDLEDTLRRATEYGAQTVKSPYREGDLWVAIIRDLAGSIIGI